MSKHVRIATTVPVDGAYTWDEEGTLFIDLDEGDDVRLRFDGERLIFEDTITVSKPEPPPTRSPESQPVVTPELLSAIRAGGTDVDQRAANLLEGRRNFGIQKYGEELHTHNGRDAIEDARQEFGDLIVYLRQASLEGRDEEVEDMVSFIKMVLK